MLEYVIPKAMLGEDADLSVLSVDFSPFDNVGQTELGRTEAVALPQGQDGAYRIRLTQDELGYHAMPEWDDGKRVTTDTSGGVQAALSFLSMLLLFICHLQNR